MERLTCPAQGYCEMYCKEYGRCFGEPETCDFSKEVQLYEKLRDYESSYLEPLEVRILERAQKDGRLYTTPAKVGDEVYCIFYDEVTDKWDVGNPEKIVDVGTKGFFLAADLRKPDSPDEFHPWDEIGDEFFLTREEAEAALDVVEVKRGEWIYDANGTPRCSECGKEVEPNAISKFCPDCGANLDSE